MFLLALGLAFLPPVNAGAPSPEDEVRAHLDRLRADSSDERSRAQRWLGRHLAEEHLDLVRGAATAGDAEVRRRLAQALADDDRHVSIAAALAVSSDASAAEVGRSALVESIARWSPGWTTPPLAREEVLAKLPDRPELRDAPRVAIDPHAGDLRLDLALEELARLVPGSPQLVLDPQWASTRPPRATSAANATSAELEGSFAHVLVELMELHQAECEGFDFPETDPDGPNRPWLRIGRSLGATPRDAASRLASWCEDLLRLEDPARRSACARAIAASGWPAGIAWLERRWRGSQDAAALDGVLLAASRGLVVASLSEPAAQTSLYRSMRADAAAGRAQATRLDAIARAIAAAGPRGTAGEDLAALAVADLAGITPREQWVRLVAVEGMRPVSAEAARTIDALLAAPTVPPAVAFQALRARSAIRAGAAAPPAVRDAPAILAWSDTIGRADECARLFARLSVAPPPGDPSAAARTPSLALAELEWIVATADAPAGGRRILLLAAPAERGGIGLEALAARTRTWVQRGTGDRLDAALLAARAIEGSDRDRLDRLEVLSGRGSPGTRARLLARASSPTSREDLLVLGALSAAPDGAAARKALIGAVTAYSPLDDVVAALELALGLLRAARDDLTERELIQSVRLVAKDGPPEVRLRFLVGTWPEFGPGEVLRARDSDRSLASSSLP